MWTGSKGAFLSLICFSTLLFGGSIRSSNESLSPLKESNYPLTAKIISSDGKELGSLSLLLFGGSLRDANETIYPLTAKIILEDGKELGSLSLTAQQQNEWELDSSESANHLEASYNAIFFTAKVEGYLEPSVILNR